MKKKKLFIIIGCIVLALILIEISVSLIWSGVNKAKQNTDKDPVKGTVEKDNADNDSVSNDDFVQGGLGTGTDEVSKYKFRYVDVDDCSGTSSIHVNNEDYEPYIGMRLDSFSRCHTGADGYLMLLADSDKHIDMHPNTDLMVNARGNVDEGSIRLSVERGIVDFTIDNKLSDGDSFEVITSNATMSVRGTKFTVGFDEEICVTSVSVDEGIVWVDIDHRDYTYILKAGDSIDIGYIESSDEYIRGRYSAYIDENGEEIEVEYTETESGNAGLGSYDGSDWKSIYKNIAGNSGAFLSEKAMGVSAGDYDSYSYNLLDLYGDETPELVIFAFGGSSGNGRYNPYYITTINPDNNVAYIIYNGTSEVSDVFANIDGNPALFSNDNNGNWTAMAIGFFEGNMDYYGIIASGDANNFIDRASIAGQNVVMGKYYTSSDIGAAIDAY